MSLSLSSLIMEYPFEKYDDPSLLSGVHGVFMIICCTPTDDGIDCTLLDYGGSVDLGSAIEANLAAHDWRGQCPHSINVMAAEVSPMNCETLLEMLHQIQMEEQSA